MKRWIWILISCLLLTAGCGKNTAGDAAWKEQYDLGVRYLSEGKYEEAIIAFQAALEIDPKNVELYLKLSDAWIQNGDAGEAAEVLRQGSEMLEDVQELVKIYEAWADLYDEMGDVDRLIQILEEGIAATKDEGLKERLEEVQDRYADEIFGASSDLQGNVEGSHNEDSEENNNEYNGEYSSVDDIVLFENILTIEDVPMANMSFEAAAASMGADSFFEFEGEESASTTREDICFNVYRKLGEDRLDRFVWWDADENLTTNTGIRDICLGDSFETVLTKIGLKSELAKWVSENAESVAYVSDVGQEDEIAYLWEDTETGYSGPDAETFRRILVYFDDSQSEEEYCTMAMLDFEFHESGLTNCGFFWE